MKNISAIISGLAVALLAIGVNATEPASTENKMMDKKEDALMKKDDAMHKKDSAKKEEKEEKKDEKKSY